MARKYKKKRKKAVRLTRYRGRLKRPGTAEAMRKQWEDPEYRARMSATRKGYDRRRTDIPDGMHRHEAAPLNEAAIKSAKETMSELKKTGALGDLDAKAEEALQSAIEVMRKPGSKQIQLAAARLVLDFTKAKPASKSDITINKAEEWLAMVTAKNDDDKGEAVKDA